MLYPPLLDWQVRKGGWNSRCFSHILPLIACVDLSYTFHLCGLKSDRIFDLNPLKFLGITVCICLYYAYICWKISNISYYCQYNSTLQGGRDAILPGKRGELLQFPQNFSCFWQHGHMTFLMLDTEHLIWCIIGKL